MDDERSKKLAAGRDRLAKFQKKKKKKKKEPKAGSPKPNGDSTFESTQSFIEENNTTAGDSVDEFSAGSSDLLGSNSDILSSLSEIDQRSIGTDDLCQDSDTSQLDAEVARVELAEARSRIHQLEESLLGKQTALDLLQNDLTQMRALVNNNTDNDGTSSQNINSNQESQMGGSKQEAELRAAVEQYNIKIQEFQQALVQRDQVIEQLTQNVQLIAQSRDAVQAEATEQTNQLTQYIQALQNQLKETGEALRNQSGEQMSSLAQELGMAQSQVTALQQNVADKDATMQQLAERYAQKAQELIELSEDREELRRKSMGEISTLQQKLRESTGDDSPIAKDQTLTKLQAELDESYGAQIVMMKQQLDEKRKQEVDLWKQRYDEMERIAAASSDSNLMRTELEKQLKEANERLKAKDEENMKMKGDIDNLNQKLANSSANNERQIEEMKASHRNEIEFVKEQTRKRMEEHVDELKNELESTQNQLDTSLTDLEEEKKKVVEVEEELAEKQLDSSNLRDNLTKEIGILASEIQKKDEQIRELNQVRITLQDQLNMVTSAKEDQVSTYQSQINDLFTEYSQLQKELKQVKEEREAEAMDKETLRKEIEEELKSQYEDTIDELNFAHETKLKDLRTDLSFEHQEALRKEKSQLETQFEHKLENLSVTKQHEFVSELQRVQKEIKQQCEQEFQEKLEKEKAKWLEGPPGLLGGIGGEGGSEEHEGNPDVSRLQAEVEELSEARDALLTQVDSTTHEKEALQEELLQVMTEKDTLAELAVSPKELGFFASAQVEDEALKDEVESLKKSLEKACEDKKDLEQKVVELQQKHAIQLAQTESEKQGLVELVQEMQPQFEMVKEAGKTKELLESMTKHRNQLLTDKEELQHRLESQEKEFEGKMLELLAEKEASDGVVERLMSELAAAAEVKPPDPPPEIGELAETLSELARLQDKAGKVEMLEEQLQVMRCKLQDLEDQVREGRDDDSDSDKLEVIQDELQRHQQMVSDLTEKLRVSQREIDKLREQEGNERSRLESEVDALQKELQSLQRENLGLMEAKENLAKDLDEKDKECNNVNDELLNFKRIVDDLEGRNKALSHENARVEELEREKQLGDQKIEYLGEEINRLTDEVTEKDGKIHELNERNASLESEITEKSVCSEDGVDTGEEGGTEINKREGSKHSVEELKREVDALKVALSEEGREVALFKNECSEREAEVQKLETEVAELKASCVEVETQKRYLQDAISSLEAAFAERKEEISLVKSGVTGLEGRLDEISKEGEDRAILLERVKELEAELDEKESLVASLEDAVGNVGRERDSYLERNKILEQDFERETHNIEAMIQKTFSGTDVVGMLGGGEGFQEQMDNLDKEESGSESKEEVAGEIHYVKEGKDDHTEEALEVSDEVEMLREKLEYIERESIREKKEYDRKLVQTEASLRESQSIRMVLEAEMKAQKKLFEEEYEKVKKGIDGHQTSTSVGEVSETSQGNEELQLAQEDVILQEHVSNEEAVLSFTEEPSASDVDKEFEKLWLEVEKLKEESRSKEEELSKMEEHAEVVTGERNDAHAVLEDAKRELKDLKEALDEKEGEKMLVQEELAKVKAQLEEVLCSKVGPHVTAEEDPPVDDANAIIQDEEEEQALPSHVQTSKEDLEETKKVIPKEQTLFKEASEEEGSCSTAANRVDTTSEVEQLTRLLDQKERREKEILTEKSLQISVLQEANSRLEKEKEELLQELEDAKRRSINAAEDTSSGFEGTTDEEDTQETGRDLANRLDASIAREKMLRKEKDQLLEKIAEQEEIHRRLVTEKEELQRRLSDKQRLEELLLEKDRLEQELARQKKNMEGDLHDLEVQLTQRENHLLKEKCQLQNELKQKDLLLRRWEVGYREHQLKLKNQEMLLEKQYAEQLSKVQDDFNQGRTSHLEKLRSEIEKRHAEAIARLRRDLHQEFALREARLNESHLLDISMLKSQHDAQLTDVVAELNAKNERLQKELEDQKLRSVNGLQTNQEVPPGTDMDKLETLKQILDEGNQKILDEIISDKEKASEKEKEDIKLELENKHKEELESLKATAEAVYSSQLDEQLARSEHEKSQALVEQLEELSQRQEDEMAKMKEKYEEEMSEKEEQYKEQHDLSRLSSEELIEQLQRQLKDEHRQLMQDLTQQWDQTTLEYLETLRSKMEGKHLEELALEQGSVQRNLEGDIENLKRQPEEDHQLDIEALISERERVVAQAEEMKAKLETMHLEELAKVRAAMQADYDQLAKAREDLEKSKSQTEQSLKQELEGLRDAFEDLQAKYAHEKESVASKLGGVDEDAAGLIQQLQKEVDALQKELTNQRNKLQLEHSEELGKLREYFEKELADTEEKWSKEMEKAKGDNTSLGSSLEEPELAAAKRPDFSHSLMTLTHISDTESSPPRSPVKSKDVESEWRQHLRGEVEKDYQKGLENLRNELENEHKAETARIKLEYEIKHEQDLEREKETLKRKHEHERHVAEMKHLEDLDNLRKELDDHHAKEVACIRLENLGEIARQLEEEREHAKRDYDQRLAAEVEEVRAEVQEKSKAELMEKLNQEKERASEMEERHMKELQRLQEELTKEKEALEEEAKEKVRSEVAQVLANSSISFAEESETQREELLKKNDLIQILKQELSETEARTQKLSEEIDNRNAEEAQTQTQNLQEKYSREILKLQKELEEEQARFRKLQEDVQSGEAPEVQAMRESLVQQYDGQLEMIKTTMNDELETLTRMTQLQSAKDLEEMQAKFVSEHEQMIERFADDQERAMEEIRVQHEMDSENMKKQLLWQHEQDKNKEMKEFEDTKEQEIAELKEQHRLEIDEMSKKHQQELDTLKSEYDEKWKKEKNKMDKELEEQLKRFDDADSLLQQLKDNHEQEKARLRDELTTAHMEKFKEVTDQLEEEHQKQLEEMRAATKQEVEEEAGKEIKSLEMDLEAERSSKEDLKNQQNNEVKEMVERHLEELEKLKELHHEQFKVMRSESEQAHQEAQSELEAAHQQEVTDIRSQLEDERKRQVDEVIEQMKLKYQQEMDQQGMEHQKQIGYLNAEKDKLLAELRQELQKLQDEKTNMMEENLARHDGEKGELDAILRERDEKWQKELEENENQHQQVLQKLLDEINQVQEEKAALVKRGFEKDTVLARRERENEEANNLISMLRSDLDRIGVERENLQQANNHLLQVLSQAVKAAIGNEDLINRRLSHLEARRKSSPSQDSPEGLGEGADQGAEGGGDEGDGHPNTSLLSNMSDEGLELSQQLAESMFVGPDLDSDGEELITNASNRLQASIETLLERMAGLSRLEEPIQASQAELLQTGPTDERISQLKADTERMEERLKEESSERQRLAQELDKTQGLLQGMQAQAADLKESLQASEQKQLHVIMDLEATQNAKMAVEEECQNLRQQQNKLIEKLDGKERDLADEIARLNQENSTLKKEVDGLLQQAKKDREDFKTQLQVMESSVEEQLAKWEKEIEEKNLEVEDLLSQREAVDKQLKASKEFLQQQSAEREQERDEFQKEIRRLEALSGKDKTNNYEEEDIRKELQEAKEDLKSVKEDSEVLSNQNQELEKEVILKDETVHELTQQIKELERTLEENKQVVERTQSEQQALQKELMDLRKVEEELTHEKDALHKQCYDQLLQISALQSKLDSHKHGMEDARQAPAVEEEEDESKSLASVTLLQQLEQEREALERKDKDIKALEEQLDQFRDSLVSKEDEISQLNLQLDVASKATRPDEQKRAEELLSAENKNLKDQLASLQEKLQASSASPSSMDSLAEGLLEEKNHEIDELTAKLSEMHQELEDVKAHLRNANESEELSTKEDLQQKLEEKDAEISTLNDQVAELKDELETLEQAKQERDQVQESDETMGQLEEELKRLSALLAIREREIAQLEAQLMSLQGSPGRDMNIQEETVDRMQKEMEDKDLQLMQLKIQVDQAEELVFQTQQQLGKLSDLPREHQRLQLEVEQAHELHTQEIEEMKKQHKEMMERREAEHKKQMDGMIAAQEEDWKKIQQLEKDYEGKISHLGKLSPGKTLQQKLDEIKDELTKQHQEHVADIQRTMAREADERIEQLKQQVTQESVLMQERHQHELEEAILRTNRDLMAAHAEEVAKIREDHRQEVDRILTASPANLSQLADMNQLMQSELELAHLRGRPSGIGQELPSQADSGVSSGDVTTEGLSDKLKTILSRIKGEGLSLLSLSELRYLHDQTVPRTPIQKGLDVGSLQEAWENEKRALLDAIQSLKDLVTQLSGSQRDFDEDGDWRGELLHTIQQVFQCEREALRAELSTNVAMTGDQNITEVQLLQRRIREQENFHKSAVEQIYGADRSSILGESRDLHGQNQALKEELQRSRQRLTQQLKALEEQSNKRERQLKRQLETMEHKYRQERILVEDLRTSLVLEKEKGEQLSDALQKAKGHEDELQDEVSDLLSKIDKQIGDREAVESRLADVTMLADTALAAFEAERSQNRTLNISLSEEKKASRSLHDAFEAENRKMNHTRNREQQIIKELHKELQQEKNKLVELEKAVEKETLRSNALSRELEAIRTESVSEVQHEKAKFTELKTALEVERSRCQELKTALQREQVLNAQLQSTMEQERQQNADASLQEKTSIAELQTKLDTSQAEVVDLQGRAKQLENTIQRIEGVLESERTQHKEAVSQERAATRQMRSSLNAVESKLEEVESQLINEQEKTARLKVEKDRLHQSLESQTEADKERVSQREKERENEKRKQLERDRERELERQKQRDLELEHQLDQQKIRSLEEQVEDWKNHAQQTLEELQRLQDKQKYETSEDVEMQRELEMELQKSLERHSPAGKEAGSSSQSSRFHLLREQLEAIRQRLQLIAVKEHEGLSLLRRMNQAVAATSSSTAHEIHNLERSLQEATAELKQIHGALVLQVETSTGVPASTSRLNTRLLNQNAELSNYISKLSDEKSDLRRQLSQLEEDLWNVKQRQSPHHHQTSLPSRGTRQGLDQLFAEERSSWERERLSTQNALRQAEREIIRLRLELEQNASNRESDVELLLSNGDVPEHQQQKYQRLYGKYLRAESFRKSLIYQKKYLLLLLGGFQDTEEASLALIAKMGGYPNPSNMEETATRSKAFTKFRSAVRVCIAISRLKYLKKKWQRACGTNNHASPQSLPTHHSVPSYPTSLPPVHHSNIPVASSAPLPFRSPGRTSSRQLRGTGMGSPPVRDRVVPGSSHVMLNGASHYTSPQSSYRYSSHSRVRERLSMSPEDPAEDPEVSLTKYIRKLENLQERIAGGGRRGDQNGRRQPPSQRR